MWEKLGRVFHVDKQADWMRTHAANPVAESLGEGRVRIFFSTRDEKQRSSIAALEIDLREPTRVLRAYESPILSPGEIGAFDDCGTSMGWLVRDWRHTYLYYVGWNVGGTVPWRNSIGLARCEGDGVTFQRVSPAPVLDRNHLDPYSLSYPCVRKEGDRWRMWYGSNLRWGKSEKEMAHVIKYAESIDGIHWKPSGEICIDLQGPDEYAISKPCVIGGPDGYRMWYCMRGESYRIGYAESADGRRWTRKDEQAGIEVSAEGWDSESLCYPHVFEHRGELYLLYNGNRYGLTGFGIARWIK